MRPRWDTYEIADNASRPDLDGTRIVGLAEAAGVSPLDILADLALAEPDLRLRVRGFVANDDTAELAGLLADEHCTLGLSDAGAHVGQLCDAPQATDFLGNWVRDRRAHQPRGRCPEVVRRAGRPPRTPGSGYLRAGCAADIVVFDPATVAPGPLRRVCDFPGGSERLTADQPSGMSHVVVNGVPIRLDGEPVPDADRGRPGHLVSPAARR